MLLRFSTLLLLFLNIITCASAIKLDDEVTVHSVLFKQGKKHKKTTPPGSPKKPQQRYCSHMTDKRFSVNCGRSRRSTRQKVSYMSTMSLLDLVKHCQLLMNKSDDESVVQMLTNIACRMPDFLDETQLFEILLLSAAKYGCTRVIWWLVSHGVNINVVSINKQTALYLTVLYKHYNAMELLLALGADPNASKEYRPLHLAARRCDERAVHLLVEYDVDVGCKDKQGCYPTSLIKCDTASATLLEDESCRQEVAKAFKCFGGESEKRMNSFFAEVGATAYRKSLAKKFTIEDAFCVCCRQGEYEK